MTAGPLGIAGLSAPRLSARRLTDPVHSCPFLSVPVRSCLRLLTTRTTRKRSHETSTFLFCQDLKKKYLSKLVLEFVELRAYLAGR